MRSSSPPRRCSRNDGPKPSLTRATLRLAIRELCQRDVRLSKVVERYGEPPLWARGPGFPTLLRIVLEQQVSLASARATFERLKAAVDTLTPKALMTLSPSQLRDVGFSRQKAAYARDLAAAILSGKLALPDLRNLSDHDARERLMSCRGIGPWTADIYLLMALRRPDVWPGHDLALAVAPWRAVAARILWHYYLRAGLNGRPRRDEPRTLHSHTS